MNTFIDLGTRAVVRGHHQRVRRLLRIFLRNSCDALLMSANLVHSALPVKTLNGVLYVAPRKLFDHSFEFGVCLAHDLLQLYGLHASILQLCKWASSLDRFVLPPISDQQNAIIRTKPLDKFMHLPGRGE